MPERPERDIRRGRKGRKKVCTFCVDRAEFIDYKPSCAALFPSAARSSPAA